jgi:hypothetical protein
LHLVVQRPGSADTRRMALCHRTHCSHRAPWPCHPCARSTLPSEFVGLIETARRATRLAVRSNPSKLISLTCGPEYRIQLTADQGLRQILFDPGFSIQYRHMQDLDILEGFARLEMQPAGEPYEIRILVVLRSLGAAEVDGQPRCVLSPGTRNGIAEPRGGSKRTGSGLSKG